MNTFILGFVAGFSVGAGLFYLIMRTRYSRVTAIFEERLRAKENEVEKLVNREKTLEEESSNLNSRITELQSQLTEAKTMLKAEQEKLNLLEKAEEKLKTAFQAVSSEVLKSSNEAFLSLARESFSTLQEKAKAELEKREKAVDELVKPISETLKKVNEKIDVVEKARLEAYGSLTNYLKSLGEAQQRLQGETANLVKALRMPTVRGRWGEIQLRRVVEMAGMLEHCDFVEQPPITGEDERLRPDLIVNLPGDRKVIIDSKAPLHHYLESLEAESEEKRIELLNQHANQIKRHIQALGDKAYWDRLDETPEFVVLFLPGETFFSSALERDPSLIEFGVERRVILSTPTTLIALLKAIAYGWRQEKLAENARQISRLGSELYERLRTLSGYFEKLQRALLNAVDAYNKAVGSLESRVLVSARRFTQLGIGIKEEIPESGTIDRIPREISSPELKNNK